MNTINPIYNESINICLASDANYMDYCFITILSILKNRKTEDKYDIMILTKENQDNYQHILSKIQLEDNDISIRFISVDTTSDYYRNTRAYYSEVVYYRLLLLTEMFEKYDKIIYLDSDILLKNDISILWNTKMLNHPAAAVKDYSIIAQNVMKVPVIFEKKIYSYQDYIKNALKLKRPEWYFNGGMMLFNLKECRKRKDYEKLSTILSEHNYFLQDQDAMNIIFNRQILLLDTGWNYLNCYELYQAEKNPQIQKVYEDLKTEGINLIHYISGNKPWKDGTTSLKETYTEIMNEYLEKYKTN